MNDLKEYETVELRHLPVPHILFAVLAIVVDVESSNVVYAMYYVLV